MPSRGAESGAAFGLVRGAIPLAAAQNLEPVQPSQRVTYDKAAIGKCNQTRDRGIDLQSRSFNARLGIPEPDSAVQ